MVVALGQVGFILYWVNCSEVGLIAYLGPMPWWGFQS